MTLQRWMSELRFLPPWLRDFHEQKDLFKWIWSRIPEDRLADPYMQGMSWAAAHVFVIDFFLWFMAQHGWTLQRSQASCKEEFRDIGAAVDEYKDEQAAIFREILKSRNAAPPTPKPRGER